MRCESAYCLASKECSCPVADLLRRLGLPCFTTGRLPSRELEVQGDVLLLTGRPVLRREGEAVLFRVRCGPCRPVSGPGSSTEPGRVFFPR